MQNIITIEDIENAFYDWQGWWEVAKMTGDIEDLREMANAGAKYDLLCQEFTSQNKDASIDEKQMFLHFLSFYEMAIHEDDEAEAER